MLAIVITVIIFLAQRRRKTLAYEIVSQTSVISAADEIAGKIQILFQGEPVRKVHLLVLRLVNTGNIPVTTGDYEREVSFRFGSSGRILTADVSETSPQNLNAEVFIKDKTVAVKPILLNSGDAITIKTLISDFDDKTSVDGRIIGVKAIEKRTENSAWGFVLMIAGLILSLLVVTVNSHSFASSGFPTENPGAFVLFMLGYGLEFRVREELTTLGP